MYGKAAAAVGISLTLSVASAWAGPGSPPSMTPIRPAPGAPTGPGFADAPAARTVAFNPVGQPARTPTVTTPTTSTTTTQAPRSDPPGVITNHGGQLYLNGRAYHFLSLDAASAATDWPVNWGCGGMATDAQLDAFFAALPPHTLVPFWASQAFAFNNKTTHTIDFSGIDRVFAAAARHGQFLLPELEHQQGFCSDGHWKDASWYAGGYRQSFNTDGRGLEPLPYWNYVQLIVSRYRGNPALGMWGLVVEPEAQTCASGSGPDCAGRSSCVEQAGAAALRSFFDTVGGEVKRLDPLHLVSAGTIGGGQCGWAGPDFSAVNASAGIDVCEVHDYNGSSLPITSAAVADIRACKALGKPLIVGETGLNASPAPLPGCPQTFAARAVSYGQRINAYLQAGASGLALWGWVLGASGSCGFDITITDPVIAVMRSYRF